jgi:hypothetical protein
MVNPASLFDLNKLEYLLKDNAIVVAALDHFFQTQKGRHIGLYGCGGLAENLVNGPLRPDRQQVFFMTSFAGHSDKFFDFDCFSVNDIGRLGADLVVLMSLEYENEMQQTIAPLFDPKKVFSLKDLMLATLKDKAFRKMTAKMIEEKIQPQRRLIKEHVKILCRSDKPVICYIAEYLTFAYLKRLQYLNAGGFKIIVLAATDKMNGSIPIQRFSGQGYFDAFMMVENFFLILPDLLAQLPLALVQIVPSTSNLAVFAEVIVRKEWPVIVDYWDVKEILYENLSDFFHDKDRQDAEKEFFRILFCDADGLLIKDSPEIMDALIKKYDRRPKWRHFPPYVSLMNVRSIERTAKISKQGTCRIVYVGNLQNDKRSHVYPVHASIREAVKIVTAQGFAFDIFNASDHSGEDYGEYLELSKNNDLFTYHFAVAPDRLCNLLTGYDYGWFCFDFSKRAESDFFLATTFGSKLATYLEAGLPVLVSPEQRYLHLLVEEKNLGLGIHYQQLSGLREVLDEVDYDKFIRSIEAFREQWSMERHMGSIFRFYQEVISDYHTKNKQA